MATHEERISPFKKCERWSIIEWINKLSRGEEAFPERDNCIGGEASQTDLVSDTKQIVQNVFNGARVQTYNLRTRAHRRGDGRNGVKMYAANPAEVLS